MTKESVEVIVARIEERLISMNATQDKILKQAQLTNGRVTNLELWRKWLSGIWWLVCLLAGLGGATFGIAFTIFSHLSK